MGIGDSGFMPAATIADRTRIGPGRVRTHLQTTACGDASQTAAAGPNTVHIQHGKMQGQVG